MHLRIGTTSLTRSTQRRAPLALAAACLLTGAAGLLVTSERPHTLVPFQPSDYALVPAAETYPDSRLSGAPSDALDALAPGVALVAVIEEPTEAPAPAPAPARVAAAGGVGAASVPVPVQPVATPEETAVAAATPPPAPETPVAVAPPSGPSGPAPSAKVMTVQNGSGVQIIGGGASISTNKGTAPSANDTKPTATPTRTPTGR